MSRPKKERTASLGGGIVGHYKTNGYIMLLAAAELFESETTTMVVPPQEINLSPDGIKKLQELISGPAKEEPADDA